MLYREIIAVCSQIHTKHINTLCGQNVEFFFLYLTGWNISRLWIVALWPGEMNGRQRHSGQSRTIDKVAIRPDWVKTEARWNSTEHSEY